MNIEQKQKEHSAFTGKQKSTSFHFLVFFSTITSLFLWNNGSLQVVPHRELFVPSFKSKRFEA
jgi:hypothetical protein